MSESKWIKFVENFDFPKRKTKVWDVVTNDGIHKLGRIGWYGAWRGYTFSPFQQTIFEKQCLRDIADFIDEQNSAHKKAKV